MKRDAAFRPRERLLLAFSGGLDSIVLLHVLLELQSRWHWELLAGHIDHGLRPGADKKESAFCREYAEKQGLPYMEEKLRLGEAKVREAYRRKSRKAPGPESLARKARYEVFAKWAREREADAVLTAHHAGDQAETVLYRMLTGAGIRGLRGIPAERDIFRRPLLSVPRAELEAYARERELPCCVDPSNRDEHFARNRIRHRILPFIREHGFPQAESGLARAAAALEDAEAALRFFEKECRERSVTHSPEGYPRLRLAYFEALPLLMQERLLRDVFGDPEKEARHISRKQLRQVLDFIAGADPGRETELRGRRILKEREYLTWTSAEAEDVYWEFACEAGIRAGGEGDVSLAVDIREGKMPPPAEKNEAFFSPDLEGKTCVLRSWRPGDRMALFGSAGSKKVSDILKDEKIPPLKKRHYPVLTAEGRIIWIPGVKRSSHYLVDNSGKKFVRIYYQSNGEPT